MQGDRIRELNDGLVAFAEQLTGDALAARGRRGHRIG